MNWEGNEHAQREAERDAGHDARTRSACAITELREELFNLRFRNTMKQLDNPLKIRESRREMARLLTVLNGEGSAAAAQGTDAMTDMTTETTGAAARNGRSAWARWSATAWTRRSS